jgi:predicted metal-binding protein
MRTDLRRYLDMAIQAGMTDARAIRATTVRVDQRVLMKCRYPRCANFGACANCPPHTPSIQEMQSFIRSYRHAVLFCKRLAPAELLCIPGSQTVPKSDSQRFMFRMVSEIESAAFYDGHVLAAGFANGSCKRLFCPEEPCSALLPGGRCRFPLKSRSSMEAVGIDVFSLARRMGWAIHPAGRTSTPEQVPHLLNLGVVFID